MKAPRLYLPKWPFYLGDVLLIALGLLIYLNGKEVLGAYALWASILAVTLGSLLFALPFIAEYWGALELSKEKFQQGQKVDTKELQVMLNEIVSVNDSFANQVDYNERQILILESLLKRFEARLESLKGQTAEAISEESKKVVNFEEDSPVYSEESHEYYNEGEESEEEDDDLSIELDLEEEEEGEPAKIIAHVLLGISSKPFIRGEGGGLSWETGLPMEFIEIGQWQWTSPNILEPIHYQIYKNDETPAQGEILEIEPDETQDIHPEFVD